MFKKEIDLIKPIIYPEGAEANGQIQLGQDNRLYRSLMMLFEQFWIYNKKELYLVGGCVRDLLLNRVPKDYDLCTNATPSEVRLICNSLKLKTFDSGIKHGTLTIVDSFYGQQYEITTYREDGIYTDGRHPDEVKFGVSLEEDLQRRDFTVNSFAYNLLKKELIALDESYFTDLQYGIIRTVGNPVNRFGEDALRMLRAIRFAAQLNFSIDKDTYKAIEDLHTNLFRISKERIRDELTKILLSDNPQRLELFAETGLEPFAFDGITPIKDMIECDHQNPWHYTDVFHHTIEVVKNVDKTFELRWAAFLHDVGKPAVKALKPGTTDHYRYINHPVESTKIADDIMETLKFSNEQKDIIHKFIYNHDYPFSKVSNKKFKLKVVEIGEENFPAFLQLLQADAFAHKLSKSTEFAITGISDTKERFIKLLKENPPRRIKDLVVDGDDMKRIGLEGKQIGEALEHLLDVVLDNPEKNTKEALMRIASKKK